MLPSRHFLPPHRRTSIFYAIVFLLVCQYSYGTTELDYELRQSRPHDTRLFTQGLELHNGFIYESSGQFGRSKLLRYPVDINTQTPTKSWFKRMFSSRKNQRSIDRNIFAEGLTILDETIFLLSWKSGRALSFNAKNLKPLGEYSYAGQGWGLTNNGQELIRSDGTDYLYFHNKNDFSVNKRLWVRGLGRSWKNINELEYVNGLIWANLWKENIIIAIDEKTGQVIHTLDLTTLVKQEQPQRAEAVLNGIAYDANRDAFWVTGKHWKTLYLIQVNLIQAKNADTKTPALPLLPAIP